MRLLALFLTVWLVGTAASPAAAEISSALVKAREGSLILDPDDKQPVSSPKKDLLHTMLSREVQVNIFRGATRVFPPSVPWGQVHHYQPTPRLQKLAGPYLESLIQKYAQRHGVDPALVRAVMRHESGFNPYAVSPKGAQGLMQLMPDTAVLMGVSNPFDPEQNVAGGVGYLRHCLDRFGHNVPLAVAAYNAGPARVAKSQGVPAIPETQAFVKNVLGSYTGGTVPLPEAKPPPPTKAKMTTGPPHSGKVLPAAPKAASAQSETEKPASRPRPKVIVVHYPRAKQVAAAKPREAD